MLEQLFWRQIERLMPVEDRLGDATYSGRPGSRPTSRAAVPLRRPRPWRRTKARTTKLYDRRADEMTLDEVERIGI